MAIHTKILSRIYNIPVSRDFPQIVGHLAAEINGGSLHELLIESSCTDYASKYSKLLLFKQAQRSRSVDEHHGSFLDSLPGLKITLKGDEYSSIFKDSLSYKDSDPQRQTIAHELAHYFQILGSSYGYLLYKTKRWKQRAFFNLTGEKFVAQNFDISKRPLRRAIFTEGKEKFNEFEGVYFLTNLLTHFFYDDEGQDYEFFMDMINSFLSLFVYVEKDDTEFKRIKDNFPHYILYPPQQMFYDRYTVRVDDLDGFLTPRAIIEGYARFYEIKQIERFSKPEYFQEWEKQFEGIYGLSTKILLSKLPHRIGLISPSMLLTVISELSLMCLLHPALIKVNKQLSSGYGYNINEVFVTIRFIALAHAISEDDELAYYISRYIKEEGRDLVGLLDGICDYLGWEKYSACCDKLISYYNSQISIKKSQNDYSEVLFYRAAKKIIELKLKGYNLSNADPDLLVKVVLSENIPLLIVLNDRFENVSTKHNNGNELVEIEWSIHNFLTDTFISETMENQSYHLTDKYVKIVYGKKELHHLLVLLHSGFDLFYLSKLIHNFSFSRLVRYAAKFLMLIIRHFKLSGIVKLSLYKAKVILHGRSEKGLSLNSNK